LLLLSLKINWCVLKKPDLIRGIPGLEEGDAETEKQAESSKSQRRRAVARCAEGIAGGARGGVEVLSMVARRIDSGRSPWRCHAGGQVRRIKGIGGSVEGARGLGAGVRGSSGFEAQQPVGGRRHGR